MRSWLGNCFLVLLYNLHICVASGSFFCISSGLSSSSLVASSFHVGKKLSRSNSLRALFAAEKSSLSKSLAPAASVLAFACAFAFAVLLLLLLLLLCSCSWNPSPAVRRARSQRKARPAFARQVCEENGSRALLLKLKMRLLDWTEPLHYSGQWNSWCRRMRGLDARIPHAPHIAVPRQTLLGATLTHSHLLRTGLPPMHTDGRKPMGARLVPQSLTRTLPCGEDFFCFLPASRAPVRSTPDFL